MFVMSCRGMQGINAICLIIVMVYIHQDNDFILFL